MLRRMSKESPPPIDELADVTLRRPIPVTTVGGGPYFSRPVGPEFMRRSCTFVAEAGWRKSSGPKDAKDRQNLALRVRQKAVELGSAGGDFDDGGRAAGRVQRLMGNVAGNMKSWSSSEDVRQSMLGAFNRTVSVITQARRSSKSSRNSIPELTAVTNINSRISGPNSNINSKHQLTKSASASKFITPTKTANSRLGSRNSVPSLNTQLNTPLNTRNNQDKLNNNNTNKGRLTHNNKNISTSGTRLASYHNNYNNNRADDHLFKKPTAPVGYKHYRSHSTQQPIGHTLKNGTAAPSGNMPRATAKTNASGKKWFKHFHDASNAYDARDGRHGGNRRSQPPTAGLPHHDQDDSTSQERECVDDGLDDNDVPDTSSDAPTTPSTPANNNNNTSTNTEPPSPEAISKKTEHLRRKDLIIRQAMEEKQHIISDILGIPREHFETLADMAGEPAGGSVQKEPRELVLAALHQTLCLQETLNEALTIRESDIVAAKAAPSDSPNKHSAAAALPLYPAPMNKLMAISSSISQQLNSLLNLVSERDDERERMRKELVASRERLHQLHMSQSSAQPSAASPATSRPTSYLSQGSATDHADGDTNTLPSNTQDGATIVQEELVQQLQSQSADQESTEPSLPDDASLPNVHNDTST